MHKMIIKQVMKMMLNVFTVAIPIRNQLKAGFNAGHAQNGHIVLVQAKMTMMMNCTTFVTFVKFKLLFIIFIMFWFMLLA